MSQILEGRVITRATDQAGLAWRVTAADEHIALQELIRTIGIERSESSPRRALALSIIAQSCSPIRADLDEQARPDF